MKKMEAILSAAVCALLLWSIVATTMAITRRVELRELKRNITRLEQEAETQLADAKRESMRIIDEASQMKKEAEGILLRDLEKMNEVFGNLQLFRVGSNPVGQQYLDHFEVSNGRIKTFLVNHTAMRIKPNLEIRFINRYGFITRSFSKSWLMDKINPNETRVDDDAISFWYGEPVYYTVVFNQ